MIRTLLRRGLRIGAVVGAILFLIQIFLRNPSPKKSGAGRAADTGPARRSRAPSAPKPEPAATPAATTAINGAGTSSTATAVEEAPAAGPADTWVEPEAGECPATHPIKVKLSSGIFHVPGGIAYERTTPDRCYRDAAAAEADGFRPSKR